MYEYCVISVRVFMNSFDLLLPSPIVRIKHALKGGEMTCMWGTVGKGSAIPFPFSEVGIAVVALTSRLG